ncbi:MAG: efflux RND transporter periplasmic adaptor subunit [Opitutaceae bacterium]|jgi:HlyD family secretion protein|nr:efflux RND transporter periplasmic adaptor subunit [Opitutaceae bacterium]
MAKSSKPFGKILVTLILVAAAAYGVYYWKKSDDKPPEIIPTTISRGDIVQLITATGVIQAPTSVDVSSQISGKVIARNVDYNDHVKEGDVLCLIDPATYKSRLIQTEAQLANTKASYTLTRLNTERTRELFQKNLVSQADVDQANAQLEQAEAQLKIQDANVESARVDLDRCTITAPIDGIVLDRQTDIGKTVAASLNAPTLFTLINDLTKLEISADVSEADIGAIALEQDVQFTVDAYPGRQFAGKVSQIRNLPKTAQSVVVYSTIIEVDNTDLRLKPGMTANVNIVIARRDNVLKIANSALRARIPEQYMPAAPAKTDAPGAPGAPGGFGKGPGKSGGKGPGKGSGKGGGKGGGGREQMVALMEEVGITSGPGEQPATPAQIEQLKTLAAERNITLPEQMLARLSGGGRSQGGGDSAPVTRTVYRVVSPYPNLKLEAISIRCGISDGTATQVIGGLEDGAEVIASIYVPGSGSTPGGASNPFGGGRGFGR